MIADFSFPHPKVRYCSGGKSTTSFGESNFNVEAKVEPVIRMSHENISVIFQKLQICPSSSVFVYLSHKAQVECQLICLLHPVMHFQNQNKIQNSGANLQKKSATEMFSRLILITGSSQSLDQKLC